LGCNKVAKWRSGKVEVGLLLVGALAALLWLWYDQGELLRPIVAVDLAQTRLDTVPQAPWGDNIIRQSFEAQWNGLQEIELLLARREEPGDGGLSLRERDNGRLFLRLYDDHNRLIAENQLDTRFIEHNQTYHFRFAPQPSAGRAYRLEISGNDTNRVSVWAYSVDSSQYSVVSEQSSGDGELVLRFTTRYRLTWGDAWGSLGRTLWQQGGLLLLALLFLPLPGALLLSAWPGPLALLGPDGLVGCGAGVGNGRLAPALVWSDAAGWSLAGLVALAGAAGGLGGRSQ
jgi:hypothetical protein